MINDFVLDEPRVMPVILLLDTSGSMAQNGKITVLNESVNKMISIFSDNSDMNVAIKLSIYTFGQSVKQEIPLTACSEIKPVSFTANGNTPLGGVLTQAKEMIENKEIITSRCYRPTVVLISDGLPNDNYQDPFDRFINEGRTKKCTRFSLAIGAQNGTPAFELMKKFVSDEETPVFTGSDIDQIKNFFRFVTMSTVVKSKSNNPNVEPDLQTIEDDYEDLELF
jgi:uncharacterized protein YegL